mgnify:CR=1 FL=1
MAVSNLENSKPIFPNFLLRKTQQYSLKFSFKDIFLRGLAPGGGLFLPSEIKHYNNEDLEKLSKLSYVDLATEIIFNFWGQNN